MRDDDPGSNLRWWIRLIRLENELEESEADNAELRLEVNQLKADKDMLFKTLNALTVRVLALESGHVQPGKRFGVTGDPWPSGRQRWIIAEAEPPPPSEPMGPLQQAYANRERDEATERHASRYENIPVEPERDVW